MATSLKLIGGEGGGSFSFTGRDNGATLKKIGVAVGGTTIKAVRAELTDGRVQTFGKGDSFSEFTFKPDEHIYKLSLWETSIGKHLGGIQFCTISGNTFEAMTTDCLMVCPLMTEHSIDVGSGVCLGLEGSCGSDIDSMGFRFINAIKSSVLTDLTYDSLDTYTPQIKKEYIKSLTYQNDTTADQEHKLTYSRSVTKSNTWINTVKIESTVSLSVTAGFPGLAEVSGGFSVTFGAQKTSSMTAEETIIESDEVNVTVRAGKTVNKEYIKLLTYENDTAADQEHTFTYRRSVTKSTTWSNTVKIESSVSMSVTAEILGLAEVSGVFSMTLGAKQTSSMTSSETRTDSDESNVKVPAGKTVRVVVSVGRAVIDLPFSATVKIICLNGSELRFHTTGNYKGVAYTAVYVKTTESNYVKNVE
ncbi:unnamed protein product [Boreogadus saida]